MTQKKKPKTATSASAEREGLTVSAAKKINKRPWTPSEDKKLKDMYQTHTCLMIAQRLSRPTGSVCARADKLGLVKQEPKAPNRIGTIIRKPGVLIHIGKYGG